MDNNYDIVKNRKKRGWKFWLVFWIISFIFLSSWALFLQYKNKGWSSLLSLTKPVVKIAPIKSENKKELLTIFDVFSDLTKDNQEKTFLILFQNNMEIRPGGGFIGSFGILKTKGEKITEIGVHDTNVFDSRISSGVKAPYPMESIINIKNWELRDSNWSADFPTNAKKAEFFYSLEGGTEKFDGVLAISTELLPSFLEVTGPVVVDGYPGEYNSENAITKLEYQVEKGYREQGIEKGKRKYIMKDLSKAILKKIESSSWTVKKELLNKINDHFNEKDVMIYFKDDKLQDKIRSLGWSGEVKNFDRDYLMMVDANLGALKTDLYIKRSIEYQINLTKEKPLANLKITYKNTARARDWMTSDYLTYLRIYVPQEAWFLVNDKEVVYGKENGKKYIGKIIGVPINTEKTIEFQYELPQEIAENYNLMIQKQSGVGAVPVKVEILKPEETVLKEIDLKGDWKIFE